MKDDRLIFSSHRSNLQGISTQMIAFKSVMYSKKSEEPFQSYVQYSYLWRGKESGHTNHLLTKQGNEFGTT